MVDVVGGCSSSCAVHARIAVCVGRVWCSAVLVFLRPLIDRRIVLQGEVGCVP